MATDTATVFVVLVTPLFYVLIARAFRSRAADAAKGGPPKSDALARHGLPVL